MEHTPFEKLEYVFFNLSNQEPKKLYKAYNLAKTLHQGQKRDEGTPYFVHPYRVCLYLLEEFKITDEDILTSALLHDVLEDTEISEIELEREFGKKVANYVKILTKRKIRGLSKEEQNKMYVESLWNAPKEVILIKLADRKDNIDYLHLSRKDKIKRYAKETEELYMPLAEKFFPKIAKQIREKLSQLKDK